MQKHSAMYTIYAIPSNEFATFNCYHLGLCLVEIVDIAKHH